MWEDEFNCPDGDSPSNDPIPVGLDGFCWFIGAEMEFKLSEVLDGSGVSRGGVHSSKNRVEVD